MFPFPKDPATFFFDFDSTLYAGESLDEILSLALDGKPWKENTKQEIEKIMIQGVNGEIDLKTSITQRMKLVPLDKALVEKYGQIKMNFPKEVVGLIQLLLAKKHQVYILSNGFLEWILPFSQIFGLSENKIIANRILWDSFGFATGLEPHLIHTPNGKKKVIEELKNQGKTRGKIFMVGDSKADQNAKGKKNKGQIFEGADFFVAWQIYVQRPLEEGVDYWVKSLSDLILNPSMPNPL